MRPLRRECYTRPVNTRGFAKITLVIAFLVAALVAGSWSYFRRSHREAPASGKPSPQVQTQATPPAAATPGNADGKIKTPKFDPLPAPVTPAFLNGVNTTPEVKVAFFYEGDETTPTDESFYLEKTSVPNEKNEKYLLLPSVIDPGRGYGPTDNQIFKNQESHSYQGIPVSILNPAAKYSLQYVGLKIGNPKLISRLFVEVGIDYRSDDDGDALENPPASKASSFPLADWFEPALVYACGPGLYLRPVGRSLLVAAPVENGVAWYKLEKPIALFNLPLDFCDKPADKPDGKKKKKTKIKEEQEEEDDAMNYCAPIKDLTGGALRLHMSYQPNGIEGPLQIQAVNFILQDQDGKYFQPTIGANFSAYYKALLVDKACLNAKQPADCARAWQ